MRRQFWHSPTFRFWLICYHLVLLVPALLSVGIYSYASGIMADKVYDMGKMSIQQTGNVVDVRLRQVISISDSICVSSNMNRLRFLKPPYTAKKYYLLHQYARDLGNYTADRELISEIYVYYKDLECLLVTEHIYTEINQLDRIIRNKLGMLRNDFNELMKQPHTHEFYFQKDSHTILYLHTLDYRSPQEPVTTLVMILNSTAVNSLIKATSDNNQGEAFILLPDDTTWGMNNNTNMISYSELSALSANGGRSEGNQIITCMKSDVTDMYYVLSTPRKVFFYELNVMQTFFIIFFFFMILLGGFLSFFFASRNYEPLDQLKRNAKVNSRGQDDFLLLNGKLSELMDSETKMKQAYAELNRTATEETFRQLLEGESALIDKAQLDRFRRTITGNLFVVALLELPEYVEENGTPVAVNHSDALNVQLNRLCVDLCEGKCNCIIHKDRDGYAALFCFNERLNPDDAQCIVEEIAQTLSVRIQQHMHLSPFIFIGDGQFDIEGIHKSYLHTFRTRDYADLNANVSKGVVVYDETMYAMNISWHDYDIVDAERRFINLMVEGKYAHGENVLHEILSFYFYTDGMSFYVLRCRMFGVMNLMLNLLHEVIPDTDATFYEDYKPVERLLSARNMKELEEEVTGIIRYLVGQQQKNKNDNVKSKLKAIEQYIATHYFDWELSVQKIADMFDISLPYLSRMFKKETGVGLLDYINKYRVEKAKELITENPKMTISQVAVSVGYNSSQTLIRIYKRYEGCTPGKLRINDKTEEKSNSVEKDKK